MRNARNPQCLVKFNDRKKPAQPTILRLGTAKRLLYLQERGLADFRGCRLVVAARFWEDFTEKLNKMPKGIPSHGV
jgi:hypothetical protein